MNFARLQTLYWTKSLTNTNTDGTHIDADLNETFTSNLLDEADDYVIAVERFELSLNSVPYYDGSFNQESIQIFAAADDPNDPLVAAVQTIAIDGLIAYSLNDVIVKLNEIVGNAQPENGVNPAALMNLEFELDQEGIVTCSRTANHDQYKIKLPPKLIYVIGVHDDANYSKQLLTSRWKSDLPRISMGDELEHIRISSNLNLVSDTVGQAKTNVVTDLSVPSAIGSSRSGATYGYSWSPRDKLIYTPQGERRYLNFNSSAPVQVIRMFVEYIQPDGTERKVSLGTGGVFNIKLGFYKRV